MLAQRDWSQDPDKTQGTPPLRRAVSGDGILSLVSSLGTTLEALLRLSPLSAGSGHGQ